MAAHILAASLPVLLALPLTILIALTTYAAASSRIP